MAQTPYGCRRLEPTDYPVIPCGWQQRFARGEAALRRLERTLAAAADNLALDEALLLRAEAGEGGEVLRLWEWPGPAVVLGAGCRLADDVDEAACRADGVPVLRRASGGGTVLWGRGCLLFSLVLRFDRAPELATIDGSYRHILGRLADALADVGVRPVREGVSDLTLNGRKFSGNAQQRKRDHLLHHGTLLYDFDIGRVGCYLRPPPRQPEYRDGRGHEEFLCNLPLTDGELRRRLREAWGAEEEDGEWPAERVRQLVTEKYAKEEWLRRR
jgi:lipoate-protein ligase A